MRSFFLLLFFLPILCFAEPRKALTTGGKTSRIGDRLIDYAHAKWVSYKWGIPLLYKPFKYSNQLVLDDVEERFTKQKAADFKTQKTILALSELDQEITQNTLYIINHFPDSYDEYQYLMWKDGPYIAVDWNDEKFRIMMQTLIKPKTPLNLIAPKIGMISVALHYRTGEGYDTDQNRRKRAMAFPPLEYYVQQLETLRTLFDDQPMYVYIFTDHPDPSKIKKIFEMVAPGTLFDCRMTGNHHDANVLEDLFSMMQFDCIIRPLSHYSSIAAHLGDFKIDISPKHAYWNKQQQKLIVDEVHIAQNKKWSRL